MVNATTVVSASIDIHTADGVAATALLTPSRPGRWPGVLFMTDIGGVRPAAIARASRIAAQGYAVMLPNAFYRSGSPPFFTLPVNLSDEATLRRFGEIAAAMTPDAIERDAEAYVHAFASQGAVQQGPIAIVGHCFTGAVALRMAAAQPDAVQFVASFHGGGLWTDKPNSPHLVLPRVRARLYFAHAVNDRTMPAEAIAKFEQALERWGGRYESELYDGALHGWTMSDHPGYHAAQAERSLERLTTLLAETLPATS